MEKKTNFVPNEEKYTPTTVEYHNHAVKNPKLSRSLPLPTQLGYP